MEYKDYYKILGVERSADADAIKRAYRKLARKYHPDVSKERNAEARFKEVNEAYEVLHDPEKRQAYDTLGSNWKQGQNFRPPPGWQESGFHFDQRGFEGSGFSDFFDSLFGGMGGSPFGARGRAHAGKRKGEDALARVAIALDDAYHGTVCNIRVQSNSNESKTLRVKIPPGVAEGQKIRLGGQGGSGPSGGPAGDLYVEVQIKPHDWFRLEGRDVLLDLPITPWEAALGTTIHAPTLGGKVDLKIPPGTQSGKKLRLKGRGLPGAPAGDQIITIQIHTPPVRNDVDKERYRKMKKEMDFDPRERFS